MSDFTSSPWVGRSDGPGPEHARWHSEIRDLDEAPGVALLGFASDEGVRRNHGRVGAAQGPEHIMAALAGLAVHTNTPRYDVGTITVERMDLEGGQDSLSTAVQALHGRGHVVVVLGGGHETSFGSHRGLHQAAPGKIGIINLDAHFDLRTADQPTSGTPFKQIAELAGSDFNYTVLGISRPNNTRALFATADELGVTYYTDDQLADMSTAKAAEVVREIADKVDALHLSIDLDVLPSAVAPGVSAPAAVGVELPLVRAIVTAAAATGKLALVDVVELNPRHDVDGRTARVAARLVDDIVNALPASQQ